MDYKSCVRQMELLISDYIKFFDLKSITQKVAACAYVSLLLLSILNYYIVPRKAINLS